MNSTLLTRSPLAAPTMWSMGSSKLAILAATLLVALTAPITVQGAGIVSVDIYSGYNLANAPTGTPYTGFSGSFDLGSDAFMGAGYNFGTPFGLSTFAAVVTFQMYMSTEGYYIGGLNSGSSPVMWTQGGGFSPYSDGPWPYGSRYNEVLYTEGIHDFEILFLAGDANSFGTGVGGTPFTLSVAYFTPWGGDPRVLDGAFSYVIPAADEPFYVQPGVGSVPDSVGTLGALTAALLLMAAFRHRLQDRIPTIPV